MSELTGTQIPKLKMTFDPKTIDHLGVKLYSSFPPVIAELISNAYDADATRVDVFIDYLVKKARIIDNGHGMTFDELNSNFLVIGRNRRVSENNGLSRLLNRPVTGKKGLGKLAVFGITEDIMISSIADGKKNTFSMNYADIKQSGQTGDVKNTYSPQLLHHKINTDETTGTEIILQSLKANRITTLDELSQSLSSRFQVFDESFKVYLHDTADESNPILVTNEAFHDRIPVEFEWNFPEDFSEQIENNSKIRWLHKKGVVGHVLTKETPLSKIQAGFIVYSRKKLVQERTFFNDRSNDFFNSYVTGQFTADFVDEDNDVDIIATDRKSLLWDATDETLDLQKNLDELVKIIGKQWREKRESNREEIVNQMIPDDFYSDVSPSDKALLDSLRSQLVKNMPVEGDATKVAELMDSFKKQFQFESFKDYIYKMNDTEITVENMEKISSDWELIEIHELAKIALGRTETIKRFEEFINSNGSETKVIQPFLEKFPWILEPRMTHFDREVTFKKILKENFPDEELQESNRRIDFLCSTINGEVYIVELKRPSIKISYKEIWQARRYELFLREKRPELKNVKTFLISDRFDMDDQARDVYDSYQKDGKLIIKTYTELIDQAKQYHKQFIEAQEHLEETRKGLNKAKLAISEDVK